MRGGSYFAKLWAVPPPSAPHASAAGTSNPATPYGGLQGLGGTLCFCRIIWIDQLTLAYPFRGASTPRRPSSLLSSPARTNAFSKPTARMPIVPLLRRKSSSVLTNILASCAPTNPRPKEFAVSKTRRRKPSEFERRIVCGEQRRR